MTSIFPIMACTTLITGGAGFIGSHLARLLLGQGRHLLILDDLSTGRLENIQPLLGDRCRFIQGRCGQLLHEQPGLMDGVVEVYHLAAAVGVQLVVADPTAMIVNNVQETADVLRAASRVGAAVLVTSSSEAYGANAKMPLSEEHDLVYGPTTVSRWSYGMAKALDEHLALAHHHQSGLKCVAVRLFNTIGPRQIGHYGMVVPRFVRWAVGNQPLEIHGDGRQTRSFADVRDVTLAMVRLLAGPGCWGQVFNIGNDREISIDQLADRVIALSGSTAGKRYIPYAQAFGQTFADPARRVPDLTRIRQAIGYEPQWTLDRTLEELISLQRQAIADGREVA